MGQTESEKSVNLKLLIITCFFTLIRMMKIQLEHRLSSCPDKLRCTACQQVFTVDRIRPLLVKESGWIQGDLCSKCVSLSADEIRVVMANQAWLMMEQPQLFQQSESSETLAMELFEASLEEIKMPSPYQWWVKTLESRLFVKPDEDQVTIEAIAAATNLPWYR
jgi:hypothetical protein